MKKLIALGTVIAVLFGALVASCALPDMPSFYIEGEEEGIDVRTPDIGGDEETTPPEGGDEEDTTPPADIREIAKTDAEVTLRWDPPVGSVSKYRLYYREFDTTGVWTLLEEIDAVADPSYTLSSANAAVLEGGKWEFAVTSVDSGDVESDLHTSMDPDAEPATGWYLFWDR